MNALRFFADYEPCVGWKVIDTKPHNYRLENVTIADSPSYIDAKLLAESLNRSLSGWKEYGVHPKPGDLNAMCLSDYFAGSQCGFFHLEIREMYDAIPFTESTCFGCLYRWSLDGIVIYEHEFLCPEITGQCERVDFTCIRSEYHQSKN